MSNDSTEPRDEQGDLPKDVRLSGIDAVDRRMLRLLHGYAWMTNNALAKVVGITLSTFHGRVRRLLELGVIHRFYTDIDPIAVELLLQAIISVSLKSNARGKIRSFIQQIRRRRPVMDVYFLASADDFILHVTARDTDDFYVLVVEFTPISQEPGHHWLFEHLCGIVPI
ncbi:AsnC family transcriptional regulator [Mycobacterium lepromatosis]|uniref:Transcriptional regulatory protein (Lrp/AsnC family) n=1 Tax=Mycobacterium lepromatosis TaxID=480418 RepID=A0A0F4EQN0_9MYCO|nr:transcriptional regulatory protein (Lrp/AsnC family) [Mycobacterium lepromatosis]UKN41898.1 AsnC family transcriptional regulator [Mycobacterium lepromatosis]